MIEEKKETRKLTPDELRAQLQAKIAAIPTPVLSQKDRDKLQIQNREKDAQNLEHLEQILDDRKKEAESCGDGKKKFHVVTVGKQEKTQFNIRERLRELELQFNTAKAAISEADWKVLSSFSDLKDPNYWKKAKENGYCENDIALYYKDVFGIEPKNVVKFLNLMKIKHEIDKLKTDDKNI